MAKGSHRMKNRSLETLPVAHIALDGKRDGFGADFETVLKWCLENGNVAQDPLAAEGRVSPVQDGDRLGPEGHRDRLLYALNKIGERQAEWSALYDLLNDAESQDMLLTVLAFRMLGWRNVPMPLNTSERAAEVEKLSALQASQPATAQIDRPDGLGVLKQTPLAAFGHEDIVLYADTGLIPEFLYSQYEYRSAEGFIRPKQGDVAFDCGTCWGATSLYFAEQVSDTGKVISFEFVPSNLEVYSENLKLNPQLAKRIEVVPQPVWSDSKLTLTVFGSGASTRVVALSSGKRLAHRLKGLVRAKYRDPERVGNFSVNATTIDTQAQRLSDGRADFIKMDVEGAELQALRGAEKTIRRCKPVLAICLYHRLRDFLEIPQYINGLNLGYKFYLGHGTTHQEETVLFATTEGLSGGTA